MLQVRGRSRGAPALSRAWCTPEPSPTPPDLPSCTSFTIKDAGPAYFPDVKQHIGSVRRNSPFCLDAPRRLHAFQRQAWLPARTPSRTPSPSTVDPQIAEFLGLELMLKPGMKGEPESQGREERPSEETSRASLNVGRPKTSTVGFMSRLKGGAAVQPTAPPPPPPCDSSCITSVGSVGHPYSCAVACKFAGKASRPCKDGAACARCHHCVWHRHAGQWKFLRDGLA